MASLPWKSNLGNEAELNSPSVSASCLLWSVSGALGFLLAVVSCTWSYSTTNTCNSIAGTGQDTFRFSKVHKPNVVTLVLLKIALSIVLQRLFHSSIDFFLS